MVDEDSLIEASFAAARRLVGNHRDQVLVITNAKLLADRHKLSERMIGQVSTAMSPLKFRDLARCSHFQSKEYVSPVVDALIDAGVLVQNEDATYLLGPVGLADAGEILDQKFARR